MEKLTTSVRNPVKSKSESEKSRQYRLYVKLLSESLEKQRQTFG